MILFLLTFFPLSCLTYQDLFLIVFPSSSMPFDVPRCPCRSWELTVSQSCGLSSRLSVSLWLNNLWRTVCHTASFDFEPFFTSKRGLTIWRSLCTSTCPLHMFDSGSSYTNSMSILSWILSCEKLSVPPPLPLFIVLWEICKDAIGWDDICLCCEPLADWTFQQELFSREWGWGVNLIGLYTCTSTVLHHTMCKQGGYPQFQEVWDIALCSCLPAIFWSCTVSLVKCDTT